MLRLSLIANALLALGLLALGVICLRQNWLFSSYRDGRPQGSLYTLPADYPVFERIDGNLVFTLPKGTVLQESTPHGVATLGKTEGKEFILVIKSSLPYTPATRQEKELGWMDHYRFETLNQRAQKAEPSRPANPTPPGTSAAEQPRVPGSGGG